MSRLLAGLALVGLLAAPAARAAPAAFIQPAPKDKCPVCGMFAAKYQGWIAEIVFRSGGYAVFDGAKDLWRCYFDLRRYLPSRAPEEVRAVFVTDYYTLEVIDAAEAFYVLGSDVYGPMGRELIPFAELGDAREFLADHRGKRILRFAELQEALPELLE